VLVVAKCKSLEIQFIERYKFLRTKEEDDEEQTKVVY
jgi:hypothetical protein